MNPVQFGANPLSKLLNKDNAAQLLGSIPPEKLAKVGGDIVDAAVKAGVKDPAVVAAIAEQVAAVPPEAILAGAEQLAADKLGEDTVTALKSAALGDSTALEAKAADANQRLDNVAAAVTENLGGRAGALVAKAAGLLKQLTNQATQVVSAAPILAPQLLDKAGTALEAATITADASLAKKAADARKQADVADALRESLPTLSDKAQGVVAKLRGAFASAEDGGANELLALLQKAQTGELTADEQAKLAKLIGG